MKKILIVLFSFATILLTGCFQSNNSIVNIGGEDIELAEKTFNTQIDETQYIKDLEDFLSYEVLSITENIPYSSDLSLSAKFDENSSLQGGVDFSSKKISKAYDNEKSDIQFNIIANSTGEFSEPFEASGSVSLLYQNNEMYANLHSLGVFMGEGNMTAKMYTLLGESLADKRVDLEVNKGGFVSVDEKKDARLTQIIGTVKNILKTEDIQSSPNFIGSVVEGIDIMNSYIDLGISTNELQLLNQDISYSKFSDQSIQKTFTGQFQGKDSTFDISFIASKKGLKIHLYNIKEYDEDISDYKDTDSEFLFILEEDKKSEYSIKFESLKYQQKVVDLEGKIDYTDTLIISANFKLEPIELISGQKISGNLNLSIDKKSGDNNEIFPENLGEITLLSEFLSSL